MAPKARPAGAADDDDVLAQLEGIELAAAAVHDAIVGTGLLDATAAGIVGSFAAHHRAHAESYGAGVDREDGSAPEPDAAALQALFPAVFVATDATTLLQAAFAVEQAMAATAVDACSRFSARDLATLAARVAAVEARHRAVLGVAVAATPEAATPAASATEGSLLDG